MAALLRLVILLGGLVAVFWSHCFTKCSVAMPKKGIVGLCAGGGMGVTLTIER
jgi:hypothetical protein